MNLTQADIYKALAANPFGKGPNTAQTWKDVNPSLPAIKIRVLGPPPTSGTRDSLADLYLEKGCDTDPAMKALKKSNEDQAQGDLHQDPRGRRLSSKRARTTICSSRRSPPTRARSASSAIPTSRKMPTRSDRCRSPASRRPKRRSPTSPIRARASSTSTSRASTCAAKPKLRDFVAAYAKMWGKGGPLEQRGLVPFGGADADCCSASRRPSSSRSTRPA